MSAPFEIVCAPYEVFQAPLDTDFPLIDDAKADFTEDWTIWGTSGDKNYTDDGVAISHGQTVNSFTPAGTTMPRKQWRTDETMTVTFTIADVSPEQYAMALDNQDITTVAATSSVAGTKTINLIRGVQVNAMAFLVRGISSVDETLNAQYQIYAAYQSGTPAPTYSKQNPAELAIELTVLDLHANDDLSEVAELVVQTAAKL